MKSVDIKKLVIMGLPFVLFFYLADKAGQAFRLVTGADISAKVLNIQLAFSSFAPSFHPQDLLAGLVDTAIIYAVVYVRGKNSKKHRKGIEYGSRVDPLLYFDNYNVA